MNYWMIDIFDLILFTSHYRLYINTTSHTCFTRSISFRYYSKVLPSQSWQLCHIHSMNDQFIFFYYFKLKTMRTTEKSLFSHDHFSHYYLQISMNFTMSFTISRLLSIQIDDKLKKCFLQRLTGMKCLTSV